MNDPKAPTTDCDALVAQPLPSALFEATAESPGSWLMRAVNLKAAADRLNWHNKPVREDEQALSLVEPFKLLLALSFENLLKGILIAQGHPGSVGGTFNRELATHDLGALAQKASNGTLRLEPQELEVLRRQTEVIEWSGQYPIPKKPANYRTAIGESNRDLVRAEALWKKLSDHLVGIGWVMKGGPERQGGKRPHLRRAKRP